MTEPVVTTEPRPTQVAMVAGRLTLCCNNLPFVVWDRLVDGVVGGEYYIELYGWISRSDSARDFVVLRSWTHWETVDFVTSSAKYSKEIDRILFGTDEGHGECKLVEDVLPDLIATVARG